MKDLLGLIEILQQISADAGLIREHMQKMDEHRLTINSLMLKIENNYRRVTIELIKLQSG